MAFRVEPAGVIAFRMAAHGLNSRSDDGGLVAAAGRCGIQNSPPGSALLALHARVRGVTRQRMDDAVARDKTLLQSWCMRGAPYFFPASDAAVFTTGVLPPTQEGRNHLLPGVVPGLAALGMSLDEATALTAAEIGAVLAGRRLAIRELGAQLAGRIAPKLPPPQRDLWEAQGPYAPGQPLGEGIVHFCLRILTLQQVVCFAPRAGGKAPFVLVSEWLGEPQPAPGPDAARAELLRRYLHCYGPATRAAFAAWLGVEVSDVDPSWEPLAGELTPVEFRGRSWILTSDLGALSSPPMPEGVRLLPPRDPYTQLHDRDTILDPDRHRAVWQVIGEPGTVLIDGRIAGTWRPRKSGKRLAITVTPFGQLSQAAREEIETEATQVAPLRGASATTVLFEDP